VGILNTHRMRDRKNKATTSRKSSRTGLQSPLSAVHAGLNISLNQCSLSTGLEHFLIGVSISRQMNPTSG
jgi:hypothetical protein